MKLKKQPPEVFHEKSCLEKFRKIQACNFIKKETLAQVFPCEFCQISKNVFFTEHLWATASEACLKKPQLHKYVISKKVTFATHPVNEINILFAIFNNKELGNFRVRPNNSILKGMDDDL